MSLVLLHFIFSDWAVGIAVNNHEPRQQLCSVQYMQIFRRNLVLHREEESDISNSHDATSLSSPIPHEIADPYWSAAARSFIQVRHATHPYSRTKIMSFSSTNDADGSDGLRPAVLWLALFFLQVSSSRHSDLTPLAIQSTSPSLLPPSTCPSTPKASTCGQPGAAIVFQCSGFLRALGVDASGHPVSFPKSSPSLPSPSPLRF